jgi:hypothetical protein
MPTISVFFGITIQMFWNDHEPPHIHATHGDKTAAIGISSVEVLSGGLPTSTLRMVKTWVALHHEELLDNWQRCRNGDVPLSVPPLES